MSTSWRSEEGGREEGESESAEEGQRGARGKEEWMIIRRKNAQRLSLRDINLPSPMYCQARRGAKKITGKGTSIKKIKKCRRKSKSSVVNRDVKQN